MPAVRAHQANRRVGEHRSGGQPRPGLVLTGRAPCWMVGRSCDRQSQSQQPRGPLSISAWRSPSHACLLTALHWCPQLRNHHGDPASELAHSGAAATAAAGRAVQRAAPASHAHQQHRQPSRWARWHHACKCLLAAAAAPAAASEPLPPAPPARPVKHCVRLREQAKYRAESGSALICGRDLVEELAPLVAPLRALVALDAAQLPGGGQRAACRPVARRRGGLVPSRARRLRPCMAEAQPPGAGARLAGQPRLPLPLQGALLRSATSPSRSR